MLISYLSLLLPAVLATQQAAFHSGSKSSLLSTEVTDYIESLRVKYGVKGISIALVSGGTDLSLVESGYQGSDVSLDDDGWVRESVSFGNASRDGQNVKEDSLFAIASNSKLFAAISVGLMIENQTKLANGEFLNWDTKVKDVLPGWKLQDEYASDHADLVDLLSMRSGMPRHDNSHDMSMSPTDVILNLRNLHPSTEFRRSFQYNNQHYISLSHMIPTLTNVSYISYLQEHIFDKLGMSSTTYNCTIARESGLRSDGYYRVGRNMTECYQSRDRDFGREVNGGSVDQSCLGQTESMDWWTEDDGVYMAGAGGVISSSHDLTKWLKELLNPRVLPATLLDRISISETIMDATPSSPDAGLKTYASAQIIQSYRGHNTIGHTGSLPGQMSSVMRLPDKKLGVAIMINDDAFGTEFHEIILPRLWDHFLGLEPINWEQRIMGEKLKRPDAGKLPSSPKESKVEISGRYHDEGYGSLDLREMDASAHKVDSKIYDLLSDSGSEFNLADTIYITDMPKVFYSHLVFTHFDGQLYNWTTFSAKHMPKSSSTNVKTGNKGHVLVKMDSTGSAVVNEKGIGMFGNFWGAGLVVENPQVEERDVGGRAEVWFKRV